MVGFNAMKKILLVILFSFLYSFTLYGIPDVQMMRYIDKIEKKRSVTMDDGLLLITYMINKKAPKNFKQRLTLIKKQKLLPDDYEVKPGDRFTRGHLAMIIARYLNLKGSILYYFFPNRRYSYRLLVYHGLMIPNKSEFDNLSGEEFIEIIRRVDEFKTKRK